MHLAYKTHYESHSPTGSLDKPTIYEIQQMRHFIHMDERWRLHTSSESLQNHFLVVEGHPCLVWMQKYQDPQAWPLHFHLSEYFEPEYQEAKNY